MSTLLNKNGFKFFFYANEHNPMHIHVIKGKGFAKVELENLKVALEIIKENQENFTMIWNEWFS